MPKLLFVVNNPDFFVSHRLEIGKAAHRQGYEVHLAGPASDGMRKLEQLGIHTHLIPVDRANHGAFAQFQFMCAALRICRQLQPDICHMITLKTFLVAGFAARLAKVPVRIGSVSGLGFLFISNSRRIRLFRFLLRPIFRWVMANNSTRIIFQNETDRQLMMQFVGVRKENTIMIHGSGVDLSSFLYLEEPEGLPVVVMASRLLIDKGVMEYLSAARGLKQAGVNARFILAGEPDPVNPATVLPEQLQEYIDDGSVEWIGHCDDIARLFAHAHIIVLPSYREGFPKVLIEAAACGRAIVTTDVPGCRDAVVSDKTAILVPVRTISPLAEAIRKLIDQPDLRKTMGNEGRKLAESSFDVHTVARQHIDLYQSLLGR